MNPLVFNPVDRGSLVVRKRYLANVKGKGLVFGSFDTDGEFSNEGYGYMDADSWQPEDILAVYEIPVEATS